MTAEIALLTRKDLYNQVWSVPMWTLAKKYGLSDVGLAKICKKHNIPRPSRGWWAQKHAGYRVQQTPLPKGNEDETIRITIDHDRALQRDHLRRIVAGTRRKKTAVEKFTVPDTLSDPHPLINVSSNALLTVNLSVNGLLPPTPHCLDIHVSPKNRERALRIMDTLIKVLQRKGHDIHVLNASTLVIIDGIGIPIAIGEDLKPENLRARNHNLNGPYEFGYNKYSRNVPSGRLWVKIGHEEGSDLPAPLRRLWRDTDSHSLEDILYSVITGLEKIALVIHTDKKKRHQEDDATGEYL